MNHSYEIWSRQLINAADKALQDVAAQRKPNMGWWQSYLKQYKLLGGKTEKLERSPVLEAANNVFHVWIALTNSIPLLVGVETGMADRHYLEAFVPDEFLAAMTAIFYDILPPHQRNILINNLITARFQEAATPWIADQRQQAPQTLENTNINKRENLYREIQALARLWFASTKFDPLPQAAIQFGPQGIELDATRSEKVAHNLLASEFGFGPGGDPEPEHRRWAKRVIAQCRHRHPWARPERLERYTDALQTVRDYYIGEDSGEASEKIRDQAERMMSSFGLDDDFALIMILAEALALATDFFLHPNMSNEDRLRVVEHTTYQQLIHNELNQHEWRVILHTFLSIASKGSPLGVLRIEQLDPDLEEALQTRFRAMALMFMKDHDYTVKEPLHVLAEQKANSRMAKAKRLAMSSFWWVLRFVPVLLFSRDRAKFAAKWQELRSIWGLPPKPVEEVVETEALPESADKTDPTTEDVETTGDVAEVIPMRSAVGDRPSEK